MADDVPSSSLASVCHIVGGRVRVQWLVRLVVRVAIVCDVQ